MTNVIEVRNLRKTYGRTVAVEDISFEVYEGEIFGMVGPNGAGKTTTIECIEGLRRPDSGSIRVLGFDPQKDSYLMRTSTGMQLQQSNLPEHMKVWEALDLYSSFYSEPADWDLLMNQVGLESKRNSQFGKLSGGQKQRLFIALALLPNPRVVFLDELTTGLDPQARHTIWDLVRLVRSKGMTIVLTTHFMDEAERLCDRVAILDNGRLLKVDTPQALIHTLNASDRVSFILEAALTPLWETAFSMMGHWVLEGDRVILEAKYNSDTQLVVTVVNQLSSAGIPFHDLRTEQATLEDVFLKLTGHQIRE